MLRPYTDARPSPIHLQVLPRDQPVRLQVSLARRLHDLRWQRRGRRVAVPLPLVLPAREVVAQRLLVEARLAPPWLVAIRRPEARRVGREDLVDHEQPLVGRRRGAELELCVRDDDAGRPGVAPAPSYSARLACLSRSASGRPSAWTTCAKVTFSSCPCSAFVAGEKMGGSSRALSTSPAGSASPASVPDSRYSAHAEPVMYPRTTHSNGTGVVRRTSIARPVRPGRNGSRPGTRSAISSASAERKWFGMTDASRWNQNALSWVSTAPLCATGSRITTSNALTRSLATSNRVSRSTSYTSRTLPRRTRGRERWLATSGTVIR